MALNGTKDIVDAINEGRVVNSTFRKIPSQAPSAGFWFDLSMSPGLPGPKYWFGTPLESKQIAASTDNGLFLGSNVSPADKYIYRTTMMSANTTCFPRRMVFMDYLLFYPLVDEGTTDVQEMVNSVSLPRYTDGEGVQIIAVSVAARTGGQSFTVSYTNQDGVSGRTTAPVVENSSTVLGNIVTSATNTAGNVTLFLPLQTGDTGVRSIESVTMLGADVGLFSLILVKPLFETSIQEQTAPVEQTYVYEKNVLANIKDDAFVSCVLLVQSGTLSGSALLFDFKTIWST